jgi:predicted DCC family thiol-disulfide oxidoreductase YuxK
VTAPAQRYPVVRFVLGGETRDCGGEGRAWTLVYDGHCEVCGRFVRLLERWDRRKQIEALPSQNPCVPARFPWIPSEAYADAMQLIGPGGRTTQGAEAIEELLGILPKGWMLGWIFKLPFVGWLADKSYRWFARNRYRFGCGEHCQHRPPRLDYGDGSS